MITKTKEVIRKLEFGVLEFFVGALMIIGLIGYFGTVSADLDWIDHTVSFILFSYLFYKLNITSILFGKSSKFANSIIIISYFSLFFKDIISYTRLDAFKFKVITFVDRFYLFFNDNISTTNIVTFYFGIIGIFIISIYLTKKIEVSHPSFLYALRQRKFKNNLTKFVSIFILLLGFYYFIYNTILEWLEFVIDDPLIATGIVFFIYKIAKHYEKFHPDNFIFKIGEFSSGWYRRFISLFHYKKMLPLAISGLLILHALSDLGVFAYSLVFFKENFYLEFLKEEHIPFLKLFLNDIKNLPSFAEIPLFINYLLNALSLIIFLLIPIIVWVRMFSQKELHFNRIYLFFIYSSAIAYMVLPGYIIKPLDESTITGVDILSVSLLESKSILDDFFPNKTLVIVAVSLISILFGLIIYLLSSNQKIKKELYAISIIGGLTFYTVYLYYFFSSLLIYFYDNILLTIFTPHFVIGIILTIFLILSTTFYIGGYLMFLYEIVMEYHKRKWSEPIDEELVNIIRKMKGFEKRIMAKKAQIIGELFKYALIGIVSVVVLIAGYKMIDVVRERACKTELAKFEIELRDLDKSLRFGERELQTFDAPCKVDRIYFFDKSKSINIDIFNETPIMRDSLKSGSNNVFLIKDREVKRSFYAGNLEILYPYYKCLIPKFEKISFFVEGAGNSAKIESAIDQPDCTIAPVNIGKEEGESIVEEAASAFTDVIPNKDLAKTKIEPTKENVKINRMVQIKADTTEVLITLTPKKGLKKFKYIESFPKACIKDLESVLQTTRKTEDFEVKVKSDPLIMWKFEEDVLGSRNLAYTLNQRLDEDCKSKIKGLGLEED